MKQIKKWGYLFFLTAIIFIGSSTAIRAQGPTSFPNCRIGSNGITSDVVGYDLDQLNIGLYLDYTSRSTPPPGLPPPIEYIQTVNLKQVKDCAATHCNAPYVDPPEYTVIPPPATIASRAASIPGSTWLIGNEMDRRDWENGNGTWSGQNEITAALYATAYHEIRDIIKTADPTARIGIGAVIQPTSLRLEYLDRVWDSYAAEYGPMGDDIDVWNVHTFILPENAVGWGANTPPGFDDDTNGFLAGRSTSAAVAAHHDIDTFQKLVQGGSVTHGGVQYDLEGIRAWMERKGERNKPLLISEYGILFGLPWISNSETTTYLTSTFDYLFNATDASIGYPADDNKLVQGWLWYSLNDSSPGYEDASLFNPTTKNLTYLGDDWKNYVTDPTKPLAAVPQQNLLATNLRVSPDPAQVLSGRSAIITLKADISNSGNTKTTTNNSIEVSFWDGVPGSNQIGTTQIIEDLPGCGGFTTVEAEWTRPAGVHTWSVKINPITGETNSIDNIASSTATVEVGTPSVELEVKKSVNESAPYPASLITYTIAITNNGPDTGTMVTVNDLLPGGISFSSYSATQGIYTSATGIWSAEMVGPGNEAILTIEAQVQADQAGNTITNQAAISADENDPTPANDSASVDIVPVANADLAVTKAVDEQTPYTDDTIHYTISVTNAGPDTATNVMVNDSLPAGVSFSSYNSSKGIYSNTTGLWTVGNLSPAGQATLTIEADVEAGYAGTTITNQASVSANEDDLTPGNDIASAGIVPKAKVDLDVKKRVNDNTPYTGSLITYTITITNHGPDTATNVRVNDLLPAGVSFSSYIASQGLYTSATGLWSAGPLAAGIEATLTIEALVHAGQAGNTITNQVSASAAEDDLIPGNDTSSVDIVPVPNADLKVEKRVSEDTPLIGGLITYTIIITNSGPDTATTVTLTDVLPAGVTFSSYIASQGIYTNGTGLWTVGTIEPLNDVTLTIEAQVQTDQTGNTITNWATAGATEDDLISSNNASSVDIVPSGTADLAVGKGVNEAAPHTGSLITYTIIVTNNGPDTATSVTVNDLLPTGVSFVSYNATQGEYSGPSGLWTVGTIELGNEATLTIEAEVKGGQAGQTITNVAGVTAGGNDLTPGNDTASVNIVPVTNTDLAVGKSVSDETPYTDSLINYTITLANNGPDTATGVTINDLLPAGVQFSSFNATQGVYSSATGLWSVETMGAGDQATLTIEAEVEAGQGGLNITNQAGVSAVEADLIPGNNTSSIDIVPVANADLALLVTVDQSEDMVVYTMRVTNHGPDSATNVEVNNFLLPTGLSLVSHLASQGSFTSGTGLWAVGNLANTMNSTLIVTASVDAGSMGNTFVISNITVTADEADLELANNVRTATATTANNDVLLPIILK